MNKSEIKKELIELLKWNDNAFINDLHNGGAEEKVYEFLSINSDAQVESRSVGDNEETKKTCHSKIIIRGQIRCPKNGDCVCCEYYY